MRVRYRTARAVDATVKFHSFLAIRPRGRVGARRVVREPDDYLSTNMAKSPRAGKGRDHRMRGLLVGGL